MTVASSTGERPALFPGHTLLLPHPCVSTAHVGCRSSLRKVAYVERLGEALYSNLARWFDRRKVRQSQRLRQAEGRRAERSCRGSRTGKLRDALAQEEGAERSYQGIRTGNGQSL